MAIDSISKRASAINVACPWRSSLPIPDGAISQGDRQHAAEMYSGILAGSHVPAKLVVSEGSIRIGSGVSIGGSYGLW
jgi:hypothetical protein